MPIIENYSVFSDYPRPDFHSFDDAYEETSFYLAANKSTDYRPDPDHSRWIEETSQIEQFITAGREVEISGEVRKQ